MPRALLFLATLVCAVLGWWLGSERRASLAAVAKRPENTPVPVVASRALPGSTEPIARDVHEVITRIQAEFPDDDHHGHEREARLFAELHDLGNDEFAAAIANLTAEKSWLGADAAQLLVGYWAERDLPAARAWVLRVGEKVAWKFCGAVFATWARSDLPEMFAWFENHAGELPSKQHRDGAAFELAKAAWRLDPERGIRLLRSLEPDGGYLWNLYQQWAEHDPAAASARALRETDEKIRDRIIFAVTSEWAPRNATAARAWAEQIPDPLVAAKTVTHIGTTLGWRDPPAGADYLARIPQTNETREALKETVGKWAEGDLEAALDWAARLDDAPLGDWVVETATAKWPQDRRAKVEQRWRELRSTRP